MKTRYICHSVYSKDKYSGFDFGDFNPTSCEHFILIKEMMLYDF